MATTRDMSQFVERRFTLDQCTQDDRQNDSDDGYQQRVRQPDDRCSAVAVGRRIEYQLIADLKESFVIKNPKPVAMD